MKPFNTYLTELAWQQSTSKMVFGWNSFDYVMLPLSPSILGRERNRPEIQYFIY